MIVADLHIHSHYSRATSKDLTFEHLWKWAQLKGVHLVGTGDIAHPGWLKEMSEKLEPAEDGLFRLKDELAAAMRAEVPSACQGDVRFLLAGEISNIYKKNGAVRKIHNVIFAPSLDAVQQIQIELEKIGNIRSDGRPILGLDSRDLLEIILTVDERCHLIPAHIWTPWFSLLGSKSGFDSVRECFDDLTDRIFAVETGLSSDPPMNWRVSQLDGYTLVSNSDAHSPQKLAREATLFDTEWCYDAIFDALRSGDPDRFKGTLEFFPEEGKYHMDGHRKCGVCWHPQTTIAHDGICSVCGKPVTVGVLHRVEELADRPVGGRPDHVAPFHSLIPLPEILAERSGVGVNTKTVQTEYLRLLTLLGPELSILMDLPLATIETVGGTQLAEGIGRMRRGDVTAQGGYDGEYGVIKIFDGVHGGDLQMGLFGGEESKEVERKAKGKGQKVKGAEDGEQVAGGRGQAANGGARKRARQVTGDRGEEYAIRGCPSGAQSTPPSSQMAEPPPFIASPPHRLVASLNDEQRAAALCTDRSLCIVAGPGTGKTRTLTVRIAYLIAAEDVPPESILAITFTNKAAQEMRERLADLLDEAVAERVTVQTFHAFGAQILRQWGLHIDLPENFVILADEEREQVLRWVAPALGQRQRKEALAQISTAKNRLVRAADLTHAAEPEAALAQIGLEAADPDLFPVIYRLYEEALAQSSALDFDDLLLQTVYLFEVYPKALLATQARFRWISVDEYQDVNFAQYRLLRLLTAGGANLCVIGDPDQAIYGFRGADHSFFLSFRDDYPGAKQIRLTQNYRSTQIILDAATQVIAQNPDRAALRVWSEFADRVKIDVYRAATDKAEAEYVVHQIERMVGGTSYFSLDSGRVDDDTPPVERSFADFAVLYRLNAQADALMEAFDRSGIPYQTVGQAPFFARKAVRRYLVYLWLWQAPSSRVHWAQVLRTKDGGRRTKELLDPIFTQVNDPAGLLSGGLRRAAYADGVASGEGRRLLALADLYADWVGRENLPVAAMIEQVHQFETAWGDDPLGEADLRGLLARAEAFGGRLRAFLEAATLQSETDAYDPRADRVALMTLHAAKGLEFPVVFVVGCEEGLLPYLADAKRQPNGGEQDVAEERRLFYVGMTRAKRHLYLTSARRRLLFGQRMENDPSRFVQDIETALTVVEEARPPARPCLPQSTEDNVQLSLF